MAAVVALLLTAVYGAASQYLGSFSAHPWAADVSLLSAPWLALAFLAGWTQREPRRAALLGLACTFSALVGYGLMTLSPIENAEYSAASVTGFLRSEARVIVGGLVTGPLFGWFGYRWRHDRAWLGALLTAAAFTLEPMARISADRARGTPAVWAIGSRTVWVAEVAVGLVLVTYVAVRALAARTRPRADAT